MIKRVSLFFDRLKFKSKLLISFFLISFVPIFILSILTIVESFELYEQGKKEIIKTDITQVESLYDGRIDSLDNSINTVLFDNSIISFFENPPRSYYELYQSLNEKFSPALLNLRLNNILIRKVSFYSTEKSEFFSSYIQNINDEKAPKFLKNITSPGKIVWFYDGEKIFLASMYPTIKENRILACMEVDVANLFKEIVSTNPKYSVVVSDKDGKIAFKSKDAKVNKKLAYSAPLKETGLILNVYFDSRKIKKMNITIFFSALVLILLALAISVFLSLFLARKILKVIQDLKYKVESVTENNLDVDFKVRNKDEIGELSGLIGDMVTRIKSLNRDVSNAKVEVRESEYKALTNQINNHFLYNTLSLLNWRAIISDDREMSHIIQLLSDYYRTTLNQGKSISRLDTELKNVQSYLELQLFLNSEGFEYEIFVDETLLQYETINLFLQPIVENSIEHGFKRKREDCRIYLNIERLDATHLVIFVIDNGIGIEPERLKTLFDGKSASYGLINIKKRLEFYFKEEARIEISSILDEGTMVEIILPIVREVLES